MWLSDSLADNKPGELLPFRIKQSCPKTRTISLHVVKEVRSGTLDKGVKVPVRHVLRACHPFQILSSCFTWPSPPNWRREYEPAWNSPKKWLFFSKQRNTLGSNTAPLHWVHLVSFPIFDSFRTEAQPGMEMWNSLFRTAVSWHLSGFWLMVKLSVNFKQAISFWLLQGNAIMRRDF